MALHRRAVWVPATYEGAALDGTPGAAPGYQVPAREPARPGSPQLTEAISAAMVELYADVYGHDRTTATTYINDNIVVCVLESILTKGEMAQIEEGRSSDVIDGRVAFQTDAEDEFTAAIERLTKRNVTAFMSANQTTPGIACELFFLEAAPIARTSS